MFHECKKAVTESLLMPLHIKIIQSHVKWTFVENKSRHMDEILMPEWADVWNWKKSSFTFRLFVAVTEESVNLLTDNDDNREM